MKHGPSRNVAWFVLKRRPGCSSPKGEITGSNVSVELVLAIAFLVKRAKQAAVRFAERCRLESARGDRTFHVRIVRGIANANDELAGVKLNIFVSGDVAQFQLPCGHANKKPRGSWDFDRNPHVVLWAA